MKHCSGYVAALLVIVAVPAMAQERSASDGAPLTDARVRIRTASREQLTGTVVALRADTMVLRLSPTGSTRELARSQITGIERSTGTRRYRLRGAAVGFLGGAAVGAALGHAATSEPPPCTSFVCFNGLEKDLNILAGGVVGALAGTTIGVVLGGRRREQWRRVTNDGDVRVGVGPAPDKRVALTLTLRH